VTTGGIVPILPTQMIGPGSLETIELGPFSLVISEPADMEKLLGTGARVWSRPCRNRCSQNRLDQSDFTRCLPKISMTATVSPLELDPPWGWDISDTFYHIERSGQI